MNANEALQDRAVRHATYLQRYSSGLSNRMIALLNRVDADLVDLIRNRLDKIEQRGFDLGKLSTKRLEALLGEIRAMNRSAYENVSKALKTELQELAQYETDWQIGSLNEVLPAPLVQAAIVATPSIRLVKAAAISRPFQGRLLKDWLSGLDAKRAERIRDAIRIGVVEGETTDQIVRRIRGTKAMNYADGLLEGDRRSLETMVRTAVAHTTSVAREESYKENSDLIAAMEWDATLDGRTTPLCRARDGKRYTFDHQPVGHSLPWMGGPGRAHFRCRSVARPVLKSWKELGASIDVPEFTPSERASMDGPVSADLTYGTWLKRQPASFQDEVLGKTKGKLFRDGNLPIERFTTRQGTELSLDQLRKLEPAAFRRAGL